MRSTPAASEPPQPPVPAPRRLPLLLRSAWYGLNQAFRRRIAHLDLTPDQYIVLRNLEEAGPAGITQSGLSANMTSDPNTVASLVTRMERSGLLRRRTDPKDRRARRLRLAPSGRKKFQSARTIALALQAEILAPLTPAESEDFLAVLEKIARACCTAADNENP